MKRQIKNIVRRSPLFSSYLSMTRRSKNREFWKWTAADQKLMEFYKQFIPSGALVFDVGANMGNRTKAFSRLAAVVVAVEPQPRCADFLSSAFDETLGFHLVRKALGASKGQAEMLICDADTISSLSSNWIRSVKDSGRFADFEWNQKKVVSVDTLDNLIAQFGIPAFVKIDVEGFEAEVLKGLSVPLTSLSFEFTPEFIGSSFACIEHLCQLANYRFQLSLGESMELALPDWIDAEGVRDRLFELPSDCFGDVYARIHSG